MSRVLVIHWNATEARERAALLRRAGHTVTCYSDTDGTGYRAFRDRPPDVFVIDLGRLPSHGRAVGVWLRQQKATRNIPIVFIEGDPEKTSRVQDMLPDATYTPRSRLRGAVRRALERPPRTPVVPGTMSGYSGTPLPKKLGIRAGSVVALLGAPKGFAETLGPLPDDVRLRHQARGTADVILLFVPSLALLERRFPIAARTLADGGRLWIVWPKRASGVKSDLTQVVVRTFGMDNGFVDYKISAIDATWSGLCFSRRCAGG